MNAVYSKNVSNYTSCLRRGLVRVKVRYKDLGKVKIIRGWSYRIDLDSIMNNPVRSSSSFIKVYERGQKAIVVPFSGVEKFEILEDSYFSVVLAKKAYI